MSRHRIDALDPSYTVDVGFRADTFFARVFDAENATVAAIDAKSIFELRSELAPFAIVPKDILREIYGERLLPFDESAADHVIDHRSDSKAEISQDLADLLARVVESTRLAPAATKAVIDEMEADLVRQQPDFRQVVDAARNAYEQTLAEMHRSVESRSPAAAGESEFLIATLASVNWYEPAAWPRDGAEGNSNVVGRRIGEALGTVAERAADDFVTTRRSLQFFADNGGLTPAIATEAVNEKIVFATLRAAYDVGLASAIGKDLSKSVDVAAVRDGLDDLVAAWRSAGDTPQVLMLADRVEGDLRESARLNTLETRRMFVSFLESNDNWTNSDAPAAESKGLSRLVRAFETGKSEARLDVEIESNTSWVRESVLTALEQSAGRATVSMPQREVVAETQVVRWIDFDRARLELEASSEQEQSRLSKTLIALEKGGSPAFDWRSDETLGAAIDRAAMVFMRREFPADVSLLPEFVTRPTEIISDRTAKGPAAIVVDQTLTVVGRVGLDKVVGRDGSSFAVVSAAAFSVQPKVGDEVRVARDMSGRDVAEPAVREITLER